MGQCYSTIDIIGAMLLWRRIVNFMISWINFILGRRQLELLDLPHEVVVHVFKMLAKDEDHRVWNYRLVSKRFDFYIDKFILPNIPTGPGILYVNFLLQPEDVTMELHGDNLADTEDRIPVRRKIRIAIYGQPYVNFSDHHIQILTSKMRFMRDALVTKFVICTNACDQNVVSKTAISKFLKQPMLRRNLGEVSISLHICSSPYYKAVMRYIHSLPMVTHVSLMFVSCQFVHKSCKGLNRMKDLLGAKGVDVALELYEGSRRIEPFKKKHYRLYTHYQIKLTPCETRQ